MPHKKLTIYTDGGSRGNPGPAAIGIVFFDQNNDILFEFSKCIGTATNNDAEYQALINAITILKQSQWYAKNNSPQNSVEFKLDSQLVVEQINGNYKIKQPHIMDYMQTIKSLLFDIKLHFSFNHIAREENKVADKLVNQALDKK